MARTRQTEGERLKEVSLTALRLRRLALEYSKQGGHEADMNKVVESINEGNIRQAAVLWAALPDRHKLRVAADIGAIGDNRMVVEMCDYLGKIAEAR